MTDKELKRILLRTGYTAQVDKEAVYLYIKQLKEELKNALNNYTKYIQERDKVIKEVSKIVENNFLESRAEDFVCLETTEYKNLKKILDKVNEK